MSWATGILFPGMSPIHRNPTDGNSTWRTVVLDDPSDNLGTGYAEPADYSEAINRAWKTQGFATVTITGTARMVIYCTTDTPFPDGAGVNAFQLEDYAFSITSNIPSPDPIDYGKMAATDGPATVTSGSGIIETTIKGHEDYQFPSLDDSVQDSRLYQISVDLITGIPVIGTARIKVSASVSAMAPNIRYLDDHGHWKYPIQLFITLEASSLGDVADPNPSPIFFFDPSSPYADNVFAYIPIHAKSDWLSYGLDLSAAASFVPSGITGSDVRGYSDEVFPDGSVEPPGSGGTQSYFDGVSISFEDEIIRTTPAGL